jgi:hypothetical protein
MVLNFSDGEYKSVDSKVMSMCRLLFKWARTNLTSLSSFNENVTCSCHGMAETVVHLALKQ